MTTRRALLAGLLALAGGPALADPVPGSPAYQEFYGGFVDKQCCWTNECCRPAQSSEFIPLDQIGFRWRIVSTGQEVERKGWSPDGRFHVCQCAFDATAGDWVKSPTANVRCLFPPLPGF
jgi:hypothetical protein